MKNLTKRNVTQQRIRGHKDISAADLIKRLNECVDGCVEETDVDRLKYALERPIFVALISFDSPWVREDEEFKQFTVIFEDKIKEAELSYLPVETYCINDILKGYKSFFVWDDLTDNAQTLVETIQRWQLMYDNINISLFKYKF